MAGTNTSFDSFDFGIEEAGAGSAELLDGLLGGADTDPDDLEEINDEDEAPKKKQTPQAAKKAPARAVENDEDDEDDSLQNQFDDDTEDEDDAEEEVIIKKKAPVKKKVEPVADEDDAEDAEADDEDGEDEAPSSPFPSIAKELFRLGVFTTDEDEEAPEINSPEQFLEEFENQKKRGVSQVLENFLGKYGEDYRAAFQAIFINGVKPQEYLQSYAQIESFKGLELEGNEPAQENVVREALKLQGFEIDDIDAEVNRLKQYGDLEVTSKRYHKTLVKREEAKLTQLATQKAEEKANEERQEVAYQNSISKILEEKAKARTFDGITVTPAEAQAAFNYLSEKKYRTPSGELLTEFDREILELKRPENHAQRVKLALLMRNKLDLTKIKRNAVTEQSRGLFEELATKQTKKGGTTKGKKQVSSWFGS